MTLPLNINEVEIQNWMSFGPYTTTIKIDNLGTILVLGENEDFDGCSNGVGKTSMLEAIVWCLFGRTTKNDRPGDKIINYFSNKDCYVQITTTDGWVIRRTRKMDSHCDLLLEKDGKEESRSTNTAAQRYLNNLFGLDFDVFISNVFFGQNTKSFLELPDQKRKAVLEKILSLDKLNIWSNIAKDKLKRCEIEQEKSKARIVDIESNIKLYNTQITKNQELLDKFEESRLQKIQNLEIKRVNLVEELKTIIIPDIELLKSKWDKIDEYKRKISDYKKEFSDLSNNIHGLKNNLKYLQTTINDNQSKLNSLKYIDIRLLSTRHKIADENKTKLDNLKEQLYNFTIYKKELELDYNNVLKIISKWREKSGKLCIECEQSINVDYINTKCDSQQDKLREFTIKINSINDDIDNTKKLIDNIIIDKPPMAISDALNNNNVVENLQNVIENNLTEKQNIQHNIKNYESKMLELNLKIEKTQKMLELSPDMTIDRAKSIIEHHNYIHREINNIIEYINEIRDNINPYVNVIEDINNALQKSLKHLDDIKGNINGLNKLILHYKYIRRSYNDRNKIKRLLLSNLIPYINNRLKYYENLFKTEFGIQFTDILGVNMNKWDYQFCSGGERKRIDIIVMFALYDAITSMYGKQCNICVMDEVDGALDDDGIKTFIDILINNFMGRSNSPSTLFVISHKPEMRNYFSQELRVKKSGSFSYIEQK